MSRTLRILSNRGWLDGRDIGGHTAVVTSPVRGAHVQRIMRAVAIWRYDLVVADCDLGWLFLVCLAKKLLPFVPCRIVSVDAVLTRPAAGQPTVKFRVRRWLLTAVDVYVLYFRDTAELQRVYGIPDAKVRYVPFKPNTRDRLASVGISDEGFFLACGRSNRDFRTLFRAFRDLPYQCRVLAPWNELEQHGTRVEGEDRPDNVELVSDDGTADSWNAWIGRAHAIVLPVEPGALSPSGIGTYLVAMALGKCVIITEGPATRGLVDARQAVLVPPQDPAALQAAITRVASDAAYRSATARAGQKYALALGGEERLRDDVVAILSDLVHTR